MDLMNLDDLNQIQKLDEKGVAVSIDHLPEQIKQTWDEIQNIEAPKDCALTKNVVVAGMGGSALGGRITQYLFADQIRGPLEVCTNYKLPNYVGPETLVILSSYSGNTEETLEAFYDAQKRGAKIFGISTGGKLTELLKKDNLSCYIFDPKNNPSGQPRMSLGYSIFSIISVLSKCSFISIENEAVEKLIVSTQKFVEEFSTRNPAKQNKAKTLALQLVNKVPIWVTSEHLWGVSHAIKNQTNENAKTFANIFDIPELNHHLLEGLQFPKGAVNLFYFVFCKSELYHERIQKLYPITIDVIEKNKYPLSVYELESKSKLEQAFELLTFGAYTGFYLSMLNGINPAPIPWVDYFKDKLK
ncbi:MAG: Bifunctional phosphoglucose/phosphomannose isomerase [Candidatus Woesebacteria bacterium GW2011_GWB1_38_5b]|uniref:Bifunctional phosphoglucose/phosphomannose isomerase n=1 Tax=Candidatus Woesebacteria bacterium GW2011_GWB1_38_5b TaxID=1618569 RepID=A0A0G0K521_9BACT|nr:MAG: Bifunctional phosphoglucose/phosphomannose isomerase [Candidatus Woesebacteria bacterium GW2011_GWB1_38_5b]